MRKILFVILIIVLLVLSGFIIVKGFEVGNFTVLGVQDIIAEDDVINSKNAELSRLAGVDYPNALTSLDTSAEELETTKKSYEDKVILASDENKNMQTEQYEIEYLWTKLGNYAKDEKVEIKIDVTNSATAGLYDLNFTIAGKYVNITEFIYDIENDSKLGFKIEDFHMSAIEGAVQGTFSCKGININIEAAEEQSHDEETETEEKQKEETKNTTNTTNSTSSNNTTTENTSNTENNNTAQ